MVNTLFWFLTIIMECHYRKVQVILLSYFARNSGIPFKFLPVLSLIYHSSDCRDAALGGSCPDPESQPSEDKKCNYKLGQHCCCGKCSAPPWKSLSCVPDVRTRGGIWLPAISNICTAADCETEGEQ